ncbi:GMC oxidoreductase [Falsiruegeria litorea]|uniref:GMC oxidoreductase n=1 Tax=Falsiruegeria litorea TaxID=1280831 RepID=UPI00351FFDC5
MRWLLRRDGLGATNRFEAGAHIRSRVGINYPDLQFHFRPLAIPFDGKSLAKGHGFQVHVGTKRSQSRDWVRLDPSNPRNAPRVRFNYVSHEDDWLGMRACVRLTRQIFQQPALAEFAEPELAPGSDCSSDEQIDRFFKDKVESAYPPCGTCRTGNGLDSRHQPACADRGKDPEQRPNVTDDPAYGPSSPSFAPGLMDNETPAPATSGTCGPQAASQVELHTPIPEARDLGHRLQPHIPIRFSHRRYMSRHARAVGSSAAVIIAHH